MSYTTRHNFKGKVLGMADHKEWNESRMNKLNMIVGMVLFAGEVLDKERHI
jgi:hypothetical protein